MPKTNQDNDNDEIEQTTRRGLMSSPPPWSVPLPLPESAFLGRKDSFTSKPFMDSVRRVKNQFWPICPHCTLDLAQMKIHTWGVFLGTG